MGFNYYRLKWRLGLLGGAILFLGASATAPHDPKTATNEGFGLWIVCFGYATWNLARSKGLNPWWFVAGPLGMLVLGAQADRSHEAGLGPPVTLMDMLRNWGIVRGGDDEPDAE